MNIPIKLLHPDAKLPLRAKPYDAGSDLHAIEAAVLTPGERRVIKTGIAMEIPPGYYGRVAPRSGLSVKKGAMTLAGVVDSGYLGDVSVVLINLGQEPIEINVGDRIAQIIIESCAYPDWKIVDELLPSVRGAAGWGSTG